MQDAVGYIGIENFHSVVVLLLYSLVTLFTRSCILSLFRRHPGPRLVGVKDLLLSGGNERQTNAKLTLTAKVRIDNGSVLPLSLQ